MSGVPDERKPHVNAVGHTHFVLRYSKFFTMNLNMVSCPKDTVLITVNMVSMSSSLNLWSPLINVKFNILGKYTGRGIYIRMSFRKPRDAARDLKLPDELRFILRTTSQRPEYEQPFCLRLVLRIVHYPVQPELPFVERAVAEEDAQVVVQEATSTFNTNASRKRATFPIKRVQTYDLRGQRTIYPRRSWTCWSATGPPWLRSGNSNGRFRTAGADFPLGTAPSSWTRPAPVVPARRSPISTFSLGTATPRQKTKNKT